MTKQQEEAEKLFQTLRPFCSALASKPNSQILAQLREKISRENEANLTAIQEYIIFPMQLYLKTPTMPENYTLEVMNFIIFFYSKITLESRFVLKDLFNSCLIMSMSSKDEKMSEDFKATFCKLFQTLFENSHENQVKPYILDEELKLMISHLIFLTLEWAEQDENRQVVLSALDVLQALLKLKNHDNFKARFAPMLPGITSRLVKILKRNFPGQSHKIKAKCLELWTNIVTGVLEDQKDQDQEFSDLQWLGKAQDHLFQHMQMFVSMTVFPHLGIRQALLHLLKGLNELTWESLRNTRPLQVCFQLTKVNYIS